MLIKLVLKILIVLTLIYFFYTKNKNITLRNILVLTVSKIVITVVLTKANQSILLVTNIYIILNFLLWFRVIEQLFSINSKKIIYLLFTINTLIFVFTNDISKNLLYIYFVLNSVLYIILFFIISIKKLKEENIAFFQSDIYKLIFAPILFFLGMSFIFGFKSKVFSETYIIDKLNIYAFINFIINIVYLSFINYYIFNTSKNE